MFLLKAGATYNHLVVKYHMDCTIGATSPANGRQRYEE
jgi:hypothetical protein